ncbi:OSTB protein, partial [Dasyornis broadbenti]|nr:OSTB protein [Dasyornis broadbenti]
MKFFWIIPFFLLQDTEAFLIKNARVKLCLQTSLINRNLLPEDCNLESDFQDWSWQGNSLVNCGTQSCLSVAGAEEYGKVLSTFGVFAALVPHHNGVSSQNTLHFPEHEIRLCTQDCVLPAWRDMLAAVGMKRKVTSSLKGCSELPLHLSLSSTAEAEHKYLPTTLASTHMHEHAAGNVSLPLGLELEQLEELLWFFRREDSSTWNYSVLALSLATMILGLVLLTINIMRNRKRKSLMNSEAAQTPQQVDLDAKQALMPVQEYSPAEPQKQEPVPQNQRPGDVTVQWKDGTVTSLYTEMSEEAI